MTRYFTLQRLIDHMHDRNPVLPPAVVLALSGALIALYPNALDIAVAIGDSEDNCTWLPQHDSDNLWRVEQHANGTVTVTLACASQWCGRPAAPGYHGHCSPCAELVTC